MSIRNPLLVGAGVALLSLALPAQGRGEPTTFEHSIELDRLGVQSQGRTGTCWSFATVSFLESELSRIHDGPVDLSEMYPVYFTYLEKARRYIDAEGNAQFGEGGLCHDVFDVIERHGLAPASAFDGLCGAQTRHNHAEMAAVLQGMASALAKRKPRDDRWEKAYRGVLSAYLGEIPETIEVDGATMTPQEYARNVLHIRGEDYLTVMSFESKPFWDHAKLEVPDNWMQYDRYLNAPIEAAMEALDGALERGYSVAVDMDVSERGFQAQRGIATLGADEADSFEVTDAWRQEMFASGQTSDDHLMHIVGVAKDENGRPFYLTKNSWGTGVGPYGGNLYMSRKFVAAKMLAFSAHKDAFTEAFLRRFEAGDK